MAEVDRLGSLVQRLSRSHSLMNSAINRTTRYHERREHATVDCDSRRSMTASDLPKSPRRSLDDNILRRPWLPIEQQDSRVTARPARITVSAANMQLDPQGQPSESIPQYVQNGNNSWVATQSGENCTPWGSSEPVPRESVLRSWPGSDGSQLGVTTAQHSVGRCKTENIHTTRPENQACRREAPAMGSVDPMDMDMDCVLQELSGFLDENPQTECVSAPRQSMPYVSSQLRYAQMQAPRAAQIQAPALGANTTSTNFSTAQSAMHQRFVPAAAAAIEVRQRSANHTKLKQAPQIRAFKEEIIKTGKVAIKPAQIAPRTVQPESKCDGRASHSNPIEQPQQLVELSSARRRNKSKKRSSEAQLQQRNDAEKKRIKKQSDTIALIQDELALHVDLRHVNPHKVSRQELLELTLQQLIKSRLSSGNPWQFSTASPFMGNEDLSSPSSPAS